MRWIAPTSFDSVQYQVQLISFTTIFGGMNEFPARWNQVSDTPLARLGYSPRLASYVYIKLGLLTMAKPITYTGIKDRDGTACSALEFWQAALVERPYN